MGKVGGKPARPGRKVHNEAFGAELRRARAELKPAIVIRKLTQEGLKFDLSQLKRYEDGMIINPDPVVLYALAGMYGVDFARWMRVLQWNREAANCRATEPPEDDEIQETGMRVIGEEERLVVSFRSLSPDAQTEVMKFMEFKGGTLLAGGGAAKTATFRSRAKKTSSR